MYESYERKQSQKHKWMRHSTVMTVGVNLGLGLIQMMVGLQSHSQALVAESLHVFSDLLTDGVVFFAFSCSQQKPNQEYQYGHHRLETLASLFLGGLLIILGGSIWYSGLYQMFYGSLHAFSKEVFLVILLSLSLKEILFRYLMMIAEKAQSALLRTYAWHARTDAISSCLVGLGILGNAMGYPLCDSLAAAIVGAMIFKMGADFFVQALADLSDRAAPIEKIRLIQEIFEKTPGVLGVHDLRSRVSGDFIILDVHLEIDGSQSVREGHTIAVEARKRVMEAFPVISCMTHVDPV